MRKWIVGFLLPLAVVALLAGPAAAKPRATGVRVPVENSCLPPSPSFCLVAFVGISGTYTITGFVAEGGTVVATGTVDGTASIPTGPEFEREHFPFTDGRLSRPVEDVTASCAGVQLRLGDGIITFEVPRLSGDQSWTETYFDDAVVSFGAGAKGSCKVARLVGRDAPAERLAKALDKLLRRS